MIPFIFIAINLVTFALMGADKSAAKSGRRRVPERNLFLCTLVGGAIGGTVGMFHFHHKTKHWYFRFGFPALAIIQGILGVVLLFF